MTGSFLKRGVSLAALLITACSQGPTAPTAALNKEKAPALDAGLVQGSAAGDVKNGPIEMDLLRVAQTDGVPAFYAFANGEYTVRPQRAVELYVQIWTSNPVVTTPPRLIVNWGVGETDIIHCGPCRLSRTYATEGRYRVTVTMDDRVGGVTSRTFTLNVQNVLGGGGTASFTNSGAITINDNTVASPYPSSINVSGVSGTIAGATVTMNGYSHTFHGDLVILVVSPTGQAVKLMDSVASGANGNNATVTFADGAPAFPDANIGPGSFTFSPTGGPSIMPGPAPATAGASTLSSLNGSNPNGTWQLFVQDAAGLDTGQIAGGWSLTITTVGSSSAGVVKADSQAKPFGIWPNEHILNAPNQKPNR